VAGATGLNTFFLSGGVNAQEKGPHHRAAQTDTNVCPTMGPRPGLVWGQRGAAGRPDSERARAGGFAGRYLCPAGARLRAARGALRLVHLILVSLRWRDPA